MNFHHQDGPSAFDRALADLDKVLQSRLRKTFRPAPKPVLPDAHLAVTRLSRDLNEARTQLELVTRERDQAVASAETEAEEWIREAANADSIVGCLQVENAKLRDDLRTTRGLIARAFVLLSHVDVDPWGVPQRDIAEFIGELEDAGFPRPARPAGLPPVLDQFRGEVADQSERITAAVGLLRTVVESPRETYRAWDVAREALDALLPDAGAPAQDGPVAA